MKITDSPPKNLRSWLNKEITKNTKVKENLVKKYAKLEINSVRSITTLNEIVAKGGKLTAYKQVLDLLDKHPNWLTLDFPK